MLNGGEQNMRKVRPEPVNEKTLVGTVVNFLHDAVIDKVPQANKRTSTSLQDIKEPIEWIRYEHINFSNKIKCNVRSMVISNILLIIGYKTGFSIWCIDLNGVASEVLSIKETQITHVKLLKLDQMKLLIGVCKYISEQVYSISIVSLISGETLHKIEYNGEILELKCNSRFLVLSSLNSIDAYDMLNNFEHKFKINSCYSNISQNTNLKVKPSYNPFAIGSRWLVFADSRYHVMFNSIGGMSNEIEQSYTSTVLNTAKSISKGITKITESVVNTVVTKTQIATSPGSSSSSATTTITNINESPRSNRKPCVDRDDYQEKGICTIIDTYKYKNNNKEANNLHDENQNWIIAHFVAHHEPIYAFEFNHSGRLLVTADTLGQYFNVFLISPNPYKSTRANIKHIYSLYRGDTTSKVKDISFSFDSRWLAVSTKRGTTHIFPINEYGGQINSRTHSNPYVVNRASRHSRTAGFADEDQSHHHQHQQQNNNSQQQSQQISPQTNIGGGLLIQQQHQPQQQQQQHSINDYNPRIRTTLEPFVIQALNQIRQPYSGSNISAVTANAVDNVTHFGIMNFFANSSSSVQLDTLCVVSTFADTRGYLCPEEPRDFTKNRLKSVSSLFVISNTNGNLIEYVLEVNVDVTKTGNKRTNDSPILLKVTPKAQWPLQRSISTSDAKYQLNVDNPLLLMYKNINSLPIAGSNSSNNSSPNTSGIMTTNDEDSMNNEWIKLVEISTHLGPHRRLFMGPQFVFKTINTNITTTALNANSSAIVSTETPLIDLSGDLELNSLDLTRNYSSSPMSMPNYLNHPGKCTPTYIEVGPGSYQDEMPIFKVFGGSSNESISDGNDNNIIDTIADAMNDVQINSNSPNSIQILNNQQNSYNSKTTAAITINNSYRRNNNNSIGHHYQQQQKDSLHSTINTNNKYHPNLFFTNPLNNNNLILNHQIMINNNDDMDSNSSSTQSLTSRLTQNARSIENIQFQDDN